MSLTTLKDGKTGNTAQVNDNNQLTVAAVTKMEAVEASINGNTFQIGTNVVNLTSDTISWLMSVTNTDTVAWAVENLISIFGATDGTGDFFVFFSGGASEGTLFSAGTDIIPVNLNIGSPKQLAASGKTGVQGSTVTDLGPSLPVLIPAGTTIREFLSGPIIIPPGTDLLLGVQPPSGNTSMNVTLSLTIYRTEEG